MNLPPYQWRADGGYRPPENLPGPASNMFFYPGSSTLPQQGPPVLNCVPGPVSIQSLIVAPPQMHVHYPTTYAQLTGPIYPPPKVKKDNQKEKDSGEEGTGSWKRNPHSPPHLRAGTNYMFPTEHTILHIISKAARIWEEKYDGVKFRFSIYKVGTQMTVKDVIQNTMKGKVDGDWEKCKGWAATEVIERGDGKWDKGTTIEYVSDKAKGSLASMGWTSKRGESAPPVWLTVHKVEEKN